MSDISSVSGETDSQLENMFPQDDEEEVEGQDRQINSTSNNLAIISQQQIQQKVESDFEFDSEDEGEDDDADSDIFDEDIQDSLSQPKANSSKMQNRQHNQNIDDESNSSDSSNQSQSINQNQGQNSLKKPRQFNKQKEIQKQIQKQHQSKQQFHKNKRKDLKINSDDIAAEYSMEEEDEISEGDGESQEREGDEDDLFDESFLQSSANQDSQRPRKVNNYKSSDDLDLSFSAQTSNQATITYQQLKKQIQSKRKDSLKNNQTSSFGSPRANRKNSEMLQKENSMIQVSKPSDKLKKQYRKYYELASLIPTLRNFEWYETTAFQNKLLPIKFLTAASFWFMVCAEYFPKRLVYQKDDDIQYDIRNRIDKMYIEIINRTGKLNINNKSTSNINLNTNQSYSNFQNDDNKSEDSQMQRNKKNILKSTNNLNQENDNSYEESNNNKSSNQINSNNNHTNQIENGISEINLESNNNYVINNPKQHTNNYFQKINEENNHMNDISKINLINQNEKQFNERQNNQILDNSKQILNQVTNEINDKVNSNQKLENQIELSCKKESSEKIWEKNNILEQQISFTKTNSQSFKPQQSSYFHKLASLIQETEDSSTTIGEQLKDKNNKLLEQQQDQQINQQMQNGQKIQQKVENLLDNSNIEQNKKLNLGYEQEKNNLAIQKAIKQQAQEDIFSVKIQEQQHLLQQATSHSSFSKQRYNSSQEMRENCINHKEKNIQMEIEDSEKLQNGQSENNITEQNKGNNKCELLDQYIENFINQHQINELNQAKINFINKHQYTFEDEVYIVQNRLFLLESLNYFNLIEEASQEEKLMSLQQLDLEKIINLLTIQYQNEQDKNNQGFDQLRQRMKKDFEEERRINDAADLDFTDILIDLNTMNPVEQEYIKFLESKQQLDYNQSIQFMQQQIQETNSDLNIFGQQSSKSTGSTKQVQIKHNEETRCQVCNECDYADNDLIVFCSRCNMSVHQKCYGIASLPSDDWICDSCIAFGPNAKYLRCALCTKRGGALKRSKMPIKTNFFEHLNTDYHSYLKSLPENILEQQEVYDTTLWDKDKKKSANKLTTEENQEEVELYFDFQFQNKVYPQEEINKKQPKSKHIWIHLTCALWIQECYFEERSSLNMIKGVENIDKKRFLLTCMICKQKKSGCCIQCAKGKCSASFHPECARRAGLSLEVRNLEKVTHLVFCQRHTPLKLRRVLEQKEKKYKDEIQKFCRSIEKYNETYFSDFKVKDRQKAFKPSKTLIKKALKDQEKEEKEFMKCISQNLLDTPQSNFTITLGKEYDDFEESIIGYHIIDISRPKQSHLKTQLSKHDEIWKTVEFNEYSPIQLYKLYKKLIKTKKSEFKNIFNALKKIKDKEQEEILSKQQKQMKKEQQQLKKEIIRQEKEKKKNLIQARQLEGIGSRKIKHLDNDNIESSQINQLNEQYANDQSFLDDETSRQQITSQSQISKAILPKRKYNKQKKINLNEMNHSSHYIENSVASNYENGESRQNLQSHQYFENGQFNQERDISRDFNQEISNSSDFPLKSKQKLKEKKLKKLKDKSQDKVKNQRQNLTEKSDKTMEDPSTKKKIIRLKDQQQNISEAQGEQSSHSQQEKTQNQNNQIEQKLYCYCQKPYTEGEFMIQCCNCEEWFHFECIGYIGTDSEAEKFDFCCNECDEDGKSFHRELYEHLFDPQQALYSSYKKLKNKISTPSFRQKLLQEKKDLNLLNANPLNLSDKKKERRPPVQSNIAQNKNYLELDEKNKQNQETQNKNIIGSQENEQNLLFQFIQISEDQQKIQQEKSRRSSSGDADNEFTKLKNQNIPENSNQRLNDIQGNKAEYPSSETIDEEEINQLYKEFTEASLKLSGTSLEDISTVIRLKKLQDGSIILVDDQYEND